MSAPERLLRAVLRLAPREFRARYAAEFLETQRRRRVAAAGRGGAARARLFVREVGGALILVARLRAAALHRRAAPGEARRAGPLDSVAQDVRFAARTLRRNPAYAVMAAVVLALGIGASTAIFSAMNAFFFRPLPFAGADRLYMLYETNPEFGWTDAGAAPANMLDWREQVSAFTDVAGYSESETSFAYVREDEPELLYGTAVTGNFFTVLGVPAAVGRALRWEETWQGQDDGVVLSHRLWETHFGRDPGVVGRTLELGSRQFRVLGVMPQGFRFPSDKTQLWYTWGWTQENRAEVWFRRAHFIRPIARLAPGVTPEQANAEFQSVVQRLQQEYPATNSVMGAGMMPARDFLIRDVRRPLLILLGAVGLLLLLACANVANLALVRGTTRARELALRTALGAGRLRVMRQLLTESLVVAAIGGAAGVALGWAGVRAMHALTPLGIDGATTVALDARVVLFTLAATLVSGVLCGIAPALRATGHQIRGTLMDRGTGASPGRGGMRVVSGLVIAEVGLALLLTLGAGLMMRSFLLIRNVDPGFSTERVLAFEVSVPSSRYPERDQVLGFQDRLLEMLESRAEIERAGFVAQLPLNGVAWSSQLHAAGWPPERVGFEILHRRADTGYFEALSIPLIRGRMFQPGDRADATRVVLVNETFAREHFRAEDPLGQRITYDRVPSAESIWYEIVGVVGDQHQVSPARPVRAEVFESRYQDWGRRNWVVLRTTGEPMRALPVVREVLRELDPRIPIIEARTLRDVWRASMARDEFILTLLTAFGALALLLATVGVYAVTEQAARRRTREIGIRMALGAAAFDVVRLMVRQSFGVVLIGLLAGVAVSFVAARALHSLLYGIAPTDPATLLAVVTGFAAVAALACYLPARRALAADPIRSLREE